MLSNIMVRLDLTYGSFRLSFFPGKTSTLPTKKYLQKPTSLTFLRSTRLFWGLGLGLKAWWDDFCDGTLLGRGSMKRTLSEALKPNPRDSNIPYLRNIYLKSY